MLVLTRKHDESISIPELEVTIKVVHVRGRRVSIGISAPPSVAIFRSERNQAGPENDSSPQPP